EAVALDVDGVVAVDRDVRDRLVLHQRLQRPEAEGLVEHLADQALALGAVEQAGAALAEVVGDAADFGAELVAVERADHRQVHAGDELAVELVLEAAELVGGPGLGPRRGDGLPGRDFGLQAAFGRGTGHRLSVSLLGRWSGAWCVAGDSFHAVAGRAL